MTIDFTEPDVTKKRGIVEYLAEGQQKPAPPSVEDRQPVAAAMPCGCHPSGHQPWCDKASLAVEDYGG